MHPVPSGTELASHWAAVQTMGTPAQPPLPSQISLLVLVLPSLQVAPDGLYVTLHPVPSGTELASHWAAVQVMVLPAQPPLPSQISLLVVVLPSLQVAPAGL